MTKNLVRSTSLALAGALSMLWLVSETISAEVPCIDSLDLIFESESNVTDDELLRTYVLCPETIYSIASSFDSDGSPIEGDYPLTIARSNIHVLCGLNGSSSNNCILENGQVQLHFLDLFETGRTVTNAVVQGLTFSDAQTMNVIAQNNGNLTIIDCIFRDNDNMKSVFITSSNETESTDYGSRVFDVRVTISGCVFTDNVVWSYSGTTIEGLVSIVGGVVEIFDSVFIRTTLKSDEKTVLEYAILNQFGDLTLNNTCFLDNDDRIAPVVNVDGKLQLQSNTVQRSSTTLPPTGCAFVSHGSISNVSALNETFFECEDPDSNVCSATTNQKVDSSCFTTLSEIYKLEEWVSIESDDATRCYRLCPGMEYRIRSFDASEDDDGDNVTYPLILGLSNVHVLCGHDGRSSNECTLTGGTYQLGIYDEYRVGEPFQNVLVQGLTFTMASSTNVRAVSNNDVTFADCIFKANERLTVCYQNCRAFFTRFQNNENQAAILLDLSETEIGRLSKANREHASRGIIEGLDLDLTMTIVDSLFTDNTVGSSGQSSGLITSHKGNMRLQRNTFYGTKRAEDAVLAMDEAAPEYLDYLVANLDGTLELTGNCFVDNEVTIAPVLSYKGAVSAFENGGATASIPSSPANSGETCQFLAVASGDVPMQYDHTALTTDISYECFTFDVTGCEAALKGSTDDAAWPRGVPANTTRVPDALHASPLARPGSRTAIFCAVALAGALAVAAIVVALSQQVRRGVRRRRSTSSERELGSPPVVPVPQPSMA